MKAHQTVGFIEGPDDKIGMIIQTGRSEYHFLSAYKEFYRTWKKALRENTACSWICLEDSILSIPTSDGSELIMTVEPADILNFLAHMRYVAELTNQKTYRREGVRLEVPLESTSSDIEEMSVEFDAWEDEVHTGDWLDELSVVTDVDVPVMVKEPKTVGATPSSLGEEEPTIELDRQLVLRFD